MPSIFDNPAIPSAWKAYNTQVDDLEIVPWTLWDTNTYTSGTTTRLQFFNAVRATKDLGNMTQAGILANPFAFLIRAVRFFIKGRAWSLNQANTGVAEAGALDDAQILTATGVFELTIGAKRYFESPLWMVTAGAGAAGVLAVAGAEATNVTSSYAQNGAPDPRAALSLPKPLAIAPAINFDVTLTWPAGAVTLAQTSPAVCVLLDGELSRPAQ